MSDSAKNLPAKNKSRKGKPHGAKDRPVEERVAAKRLYLMKHLAGERVSLKGVAQELGINANTVAGWSAKEGWPKIAETLKAEGEAEFQAEAKDLLKEAKSLATDIALTVLRKIHKDVMDKKAKNPIAVKSIWELKALIESVGTLTGDVNSSGLVINVDARQYSPEIQQQIVDLGKRLLNPDADLPEAGAQLPVFSGGMVVEAEEESSDPPEVREAPMPGTVQ